VSGCSTGEEELFKSRARENGSVKIIDLITARLDAGTDSYVAALPSLRLNDVRISPEMISANERMLTGGFYAEIQLEYDATISQERGGVLSVFHHSADPALPGGVLEDVARGRLDSRRKSGSISCSGASGWNQVDSLSAPWM